MDNELRRRRWIVRRRLEGWIVSRIAEALKMSEKTVDRWLSLYRKEGWEGLRVKSRRPHIIYRTPEGTVEAVLELRRTRNWGPCKIEGYLRNYGIGVAPISHRTIHKILVQTGFNNPIKARERHGASVDSSDRTVTTCGNQTTR